MKWEDLQDGWNRLGCIEEQSSCVGLNSTQIGGGGGLDLSQGQTFSSLDLKGRPVWRERKRRV